MVTNRIPTKTWAAREGKMYIGRCGAGNVFDNTSTLSGVFISGISGHCISPAVKNITITPPETTWEKQDLLGQDSSNFQNQLLDQKPVGLATLTATMILAEDEMVADYVTSGTATGFSGYTRYQIGNEGVNRIVAVVEVSNDAATQNVSFGLEDARITKWGDIRVSGPDGHWEQDITLICLAKDFFYEFQD